MHTTKGQAAMEFLMTYGWAILAAIIAIGVLAYFGVFSPGKYAPAATVLNPPFYVQGASVSATAILIEIKNNGGDYLNITSIITTVPGCVGGSLDPQINMSAGGQQTITVPGACTLTSGKIAKGDLNVRYRKEGSLLDLSSSGTLTEKIQ